MGRSGIEPPPANESRFVADEDPGRLDLAHPIVASGDVVTVGIETNRVVGTVDGDGFLANAQQHITQGTLAGKLVLSVWAEIAARDTGGTLGRDGLEVEVVLHRGMTGRELSLGKLRGGFGTTWQDFQFDVDVTNVRWPADPCPGQSPAASCGRAVEPASNELSFVFTGFITPGMHITFEVDWLTLEPKAAAGLAWRPVLLVHGLGATSASMRAGTAWFDGLQARDVGAHAVNLTPKGSIANNGAQLAQFVDDLRRRFGVERVHLVGHSKGGIDGREYARYHDDIETLIMLAAPNGGSFVADYVASQAFPAALIGEFFRGSIYQTSAYMRAYNAFTVRNPETTYVTAAGDHDSTWAATLGIAYGPNDLVVAVSSVEVLPYARARTFLSPTIETTHSGLRSNTRVVDDLFPVYVAALTPPPAASSVGPDHDQEPAAGTQTLMSGSGIAAGGVPVAYTAVIDPLTAALFLMIGDPDALRFELVSPSGERVDAGTPALDPAVVADTYRDDGSLSYIGYQVEAPEPGSWTLEVVDTGAESPGGGAHAVAVAAPSAPAGTGVSLTAAVAPLQVAGEAVTITATLTEDGLAVTGAAVVAMVVHPDGVTTTEVALDPDDPAATTGGYHGSFADTAEAGLYAVVVAAERADPPFTRQQLLQFSVVLGAAGFSGVISDHGADLDGDGRFDQLVVEVELEVGAAATYRLFGTLTDGFGTAIEQVRVERELPPGLQTVPLAFDGAALSALGHDGPYLVEDLVLEEVASATGLAVGPPYTTAAYAPTDFQRPTLLLTGVTGDRGSHDQHMDQLPYEALVIELELDSLAGGEVQASAQLFSEDGTHIAPGTVAAALVPGTNLLAFRFPASGIFGGGRPGPYRLQLLSVWEPSPAGATPLTLQAPGVVAVTQPYAVEDFAPSPRFTVGGTVTGLAGPPLELELAAVGPRGTPPTTTLRAGNGAFTFLFPTLVGGNTYEVRVKTQPTNPPQVCTVANGAGTIGDANVTDVTVTCA